MNIFKQWRTERDLGQKEAGMACGVDRITWWRWEKGISKVSIDKLDDVEKATGVSRHLLRPDIFGPAEKVA